MNAANQVKGRVCLYSNDNKSLQELFSFNDYNNAKQ